MAMTRDEVLSELGPVGEASVAEIVSTGATVEELRKSLAWLINGEALKWRRPSVPGTRNAA